MGRVVGRGSLEGGWGGWVGQQKSIRLQRRSWVVGPMSSPAPDVAGAAVRAVSPAAEAIRC